jgi:hypothetical protein
MTIKGVIIEDGRLVIVSVPFIRHSFKKAVMM